MPIVAPIIFVSMLVGLGSFAWILFKHPEAVTPEKELENTKQNRKAVIESILKDKLRRLFGGKEKP